MPETDNRLGDTEKDVSPVTLAVQHLQELDTRLQRSEFGLNNQDVRVIDHVIAAILELEEERLKAHDQLETETIKTSVFRHQLRHLPRLYRNEITEGVQDARLSNKDLIAKLKGQLATVESNSERLHKRYEFLDAENARLVPEKEALRMKHEGIIASLNARMADKASQQIVLNETRDEAQATLQAVLDVEDNILQLEDQMTEERNTNNEQVTHLEKLIGERTKRTEQQKEVNRATANRLEELTSELTNSEEELDRLRKKIRKFETSQGKLEAEERVLEAQLARESKSNEELRKAGQKIQLKTQTTKNSVALENDENQAIMRELSAELEHKHGEKGKLERKREQLENEASRMKERSQESTKRVNEVTDILEASWAAVTAKQKEVGRLEQEIDRMKEETEDLIDSHRTCVQNYSRQIEEYTEQLKKERTERIEIQTNRESVGKDLDEAKQTNEKYFTEVTSQVKQTKVQHKTLTQEGSSLEGAIEEAEEKIAFLGKRVEEEMTELEKNKETLTNKISVIKIEIGGLQDEQKLAKEVYAAKHPELEVMELSTKESEEAFERVKKQVSKWKTTRLSLEDQVKSTSRDLDKQTHPLLGMRTVLKEEKHEYLELVQAQMAEISQLEKEIYIDGTKLEKVSQENYKFKISNRAVERELVVLARREKDISAQLKRLNAEYAAIKALLEMGWMEDNEMEAESSERDQAILVQLAAMLENAAIRQVAVDGVNNHLDSELGHFAEFLDIVAERRPPEMITAEVGTAVGPSLTELVSADDLLRETSTIDADDVSSNRATPRSHKHDPHNLGQEHGETWATRVGKTPPVLSGKSPNNPPKSLRGGSAKGRELPAHSVLPPIERRPASSDTNKHRNNNSNRQDDRVTEDDSSVGDYDSERRSVFVATTVQKKTTTEDSIALADTSPSAASNAGGSASPGIAQIETVSDIMKELGLETSEQS